MSVRGRTIRKGGQLVSSIMANIDLGLHRDIEAGVMIERSDLRLGLPGRRLVTDRALQRAVPTPLCCLS